MKKLAAVLCLFISLSSFAQIHHKTTSNDSKSKAKIFLNQLLQKQYERDMPAAKTTTIKQRLIAQAEATRAYSYTNDSFSVVYSGQRGSTFNLQAMSYMESPGAPRIYPVNSPFGLSPSTGYWSQNNKMAILGDIFYKYIITPFYPYTFSHWATETCTYDADNNLLLDIFNGDPTLSISTLKGAASFNSPSEMTKLVWLQYGLSSATSWDSTDMAIMSYNSSNQLKTDSQCTYNMSTLLFEPAQKFTYNYDAAGNLIYIQSWTWNFTSWLLQGDYVLTYYLTTNKLKTYASHTYIGSDPDYRDSFGYSPGISYSTYQQEMQYSVPALMLIDSTITTRHVNAAGLPDTIQVMQYSGLPFQHGMQIYYYNSYNNPDSVQNYGDTTIAIPTAPEGGMYFHYELYNSTGVPAAMTTIDAFSMYPNPASSKLTISHPGFTKNEMVGITISNITGQKIRSEQLPWQHETEEINVADLLPGQYYITVSGNNGQMWTQKIIKL